MPEVEDRCPVALVKESCLGDGAFGWISSWSRWKRHGLLPYDGGLGDQPSWLAEGLLLVDDEVEAMRVKKDTPQRPPEGLTRG